MIRPEPLLPLVRIPARRAALAAALAMTCAVGFILGALALAFVDLRTTRARAAAD